MISWLQVKSVKTEQVNANLVQGCFEFAFHVGRSRSAIAQMDRQSSCPVYHRKFPHCCSTFWHASIFVFLVSIYDTRARSLEHVSNYAHHVNATFSAVSDWPYSKAAIWLVLRTYVLVYTFVLSYSCGWSSFFLFCCMSSYWSTIHRYRYGRSCCKNHFSRMLQI